MIPKDIYIYWDKIDQPEIVKICINSIKKYCSDYNIHVLNNLTYKNYIKKKEPSIIKKYRIQSKSDWIRTVLLKENGGIWMDASIILTENIDNWIDLNKHFIGIKTEYRIDNWFFAFPKNSKLAEKWLDEYERALEIGPTKYIENVGKINNWISGTYLFHQLCFLNSCKILNLNLNNKSKYYIIDNHKLGFPSSNYNIRHTTINQIINVLSFNKKNKDCAPLYKITRKTRIFFDYVKNTKIEKCSPLYLVGYSNNNKITFHYNLLNLTIKYIILIVTYFFQLFKIL